MLNMKVTSTLKWPNSNIFHQASLNCFYVILYVETYKDLHDNNIWNRGLEF